jgi:hypothetical protein
MEHPNQYLSRNERSRCVFGIGDKTDTEQRDYEEKPLHYNRLGKDHNREQRE